MCLNDWSVPHTLVRKTLTVAAGPDQVRVLDGQTVVAMHMRCYDRGQQIEDASHIAKLVERKAQAHEQLGMSRLIQAAPAGKELLERAAERGERLGGITTALLRLIDRYGAAEVQAAILVALERGVPHPNAVRLALEAQREALHQPPPVAAPMPAHVAARDTTVRPHRWKAGKLRSIDEYGRGGMMNLERLRERAEALRLYGVLAHWPEATAADWLAPLVRVGKRMNAPGAAWKPVGLKGIGCKMT